MNDFWKICKATMILSSMAFLGVNAQDAAPKYDFSDYTVTYYIDSQVVDIHKFIWDKRNMQSVSMDKKNKAVYISRKEKYIWAPFIMILEEELLCSRTVPEDLTITIDGVDYRYKDVQDFMIEFSPKLHINALSHAAHDELGDGHRTGSIALSRIVITHE